MLKDPKFDKSKARFYGTSLSMKSGMSISSTNSKGGAPLSRA